MTKFYIDGSGWNGTVSKSCVTQRSECDTFNLYNFVTIYEFELTNNEAEYYALIEALKRAKNGDEIFTDSELIVKQLLGEYQINFEHLQKLVDIVKKLISPNIKLSHVSRNENCAGKVLEKR